MGVVKPVPVRGSPDPQRDAELRQLSDLLEDGIKDLTAGRLIESDDVRRHVEAKIQAHRTPPARAR